MPSAGKAYGSKSSQGRLGASVVQARESGTGHTNIGNLLLTLLQKGLFEVGDPFCISTGKPLEGETILSE